MTKRDDLIALRDAVETGDDISWSYVAGPARGTLGDRWHDALDAFCDSLDAALRLHDALLPGFYWAIEQDDDFGFCAQVYSGRWVHGHGETPARAWLIAILTALIEQEDASASG